MAPKCSLSTPLGFLGIPQGAAKMSHGLFYYSKVSLCGMVSLAGIQCLISNQQQNVCSVFGLEAQRTEKQTNSKTGVRFFCLGLFYWEFLNLTADKCSVKLDRVKG